MVQVPILQGVFTDNGPDVRQSMPVNMVPVAAPSGVSEGYLRPAEGLILVNSAPGVIRASGTWKGRLYMLLGDSFSEISPTGVRTDLGTVSSGGTARFAFGFNEMAIATGGRLWVWDGSTLSMVVDPNIGTVRDVAWIDSYYVVTDGEIVRNNLLGDPFTWPALAFFDPESSPDGVVGLQVLRNQLVVVGTETTEYYDNVGTLPCPFARIDGAQVPRGAIGTHASAVFSEAIAFIGGGKNEQPCVWLGTAGQTAKLSSEEVDQILSGFTSTQLADVVVEARNPTGRQELWIHLPDRSLVFDAIASRATKVPAWTCMVTTITVDAFAAFTGRHFCWFADRWWVGDSSLGAYGYTSETDSRHWGEHVRWSFATSMLYNESRGAIVHSLELVGLPGRVSLFSEPTVATSYSLDGRAWSEDVFIGSGSKGDSTRRLIWRRQGMWRNFRIQRFRGTSVDRLAVMRLEATIEGLAH